MIIYKWLFEKFTLHSLSAPNKQGIPEPKKDCAHVIHGSIEHNQGVV